STDILKIKPNLIPKGITLNPLSKKSTIKAALYSAAFIIQSQVASNLDIDPEEIEVTKYSISRVGDSLIGEIAFADRLQNGAGFVNWISNNWNDILQSIVNPIDIDSFSWSLLSENHRTECKSACYKCLMSYNKMQYNSLLDWRLGISYLRILYDPSHNCGIDSIEMLGNESRYPELDNWLNFARQLAKDFGDAYNCIFSENGHLPIVRKDDNIGIICHPLWDTYNPRSILAEASAECESSKITYIDTFNLLRRPSTCYKWLISGDD
ncbi:hypothetical protein, partial [Methanocalculus sp.]|uniref:hypothetical protein n=1 Tax=Methanocalculus sp. TaxID=2004547 RepID=UPI00261E213D